MPASHDPVGPAVTLGDDLAAALPELRAAAESRMLDACTVRRAVGVTVDDVGVTTPDYSEPLYEGPCRVQTFEPQEYTPDVAVATVTTQRYAVHVPVGAYEPSIGDVVEISTATLDPHLAGREYRVVALLHKSQATAYRLGVLEIVD